MKFIQKKVLLPAGIKEVAMATIIDGTVKITIGSDKKGYKLEGECPNCGTKIIVETKTGGTFCSIATCSRCKKLYRIKYDEVATAYLIWKIKPHLFAVYYRLEKAVGCLCEWDTIFNRIREGLFENIGNIDDESITNGFACIHAPEKREQGLPDIIVDKNKKEICFRIFGFYNLEEARDIIKSHVGIFSESFEINLNPLAYECWEHDGKEGKVLIKRWDLTKTEKIDIKKFTFHGNKPGKA